MKNMLALAAGCALLLGGCNGKNKAVSDTDRSDSLTLLIGSYSEPDDSALSVYSFNPDDGSGRYLYSLPVANASFLDISDSGVVYAVCESGEESSAIYALSPDSDGELKVINSQPVGSADPCYVKISPDGRFVVTANYTGGNVAVFPIKNDGTLEPRRQLLSFTGNGPVASRQEGPHPHCISFTPDGRYMLVDDLGSDRIHQFSVVTDSDSLVSSVPDNDIVLEPGSGPRHIEFNGKGDRAYLINELSDKVTELSYDGATLKPVRYIAADTVGAGGAADIHLSADGRHLYASLRLKHDGIASFEVDSVTGNLSYIGHTPTAGHPRNFTFTPDGRYMIVACRDGNEVQIFKVDNNTGSLTDTGRRIKLSKPVFVRFYHE